MKKFLHLFLHNSGFWVTFSMLFSKLSALLITIITARLISSEELGTVLYALNFVGFFIPLIGMGSYQGSLRYGSLYDDPVEKEKVLQYSFYYGMLGQLLISIVMVSISLFLIQDISVIHIILLLSSRLAGIFLLEQAKANYRARGNNKKFALSEIIFSLLSIISTSIGTYFFGLIGYLVSLCVAPFFILFYHRFTIKKTTVPCAHSEFWEFCFFTAFTMQVWQWIYLLDVFLVGYFYSKSEVSFYKLSAMIPFNLMFISQSILQTEYPKFVKNQYNPQFFIQFYKNYSILFLFISCVILIISYMFSTEIMSLFGDNYKNPSIFLVLIWVTIFSAFFRIPFGNWLAGIGRSDLNLYVAFSSLLILFVGGVLMQKPFGIIGIAYASCLSFIVSGLLAMLLFIRYFPKKQ